MQSVELRYGDPPPESDCTDYGSLTVPRTLELEVSDIELQQRELSLSDLFGSKLTPWARARYAVRRVEKKGVPGKVRVDGLGTVIVGKEGWVVK